MKVEFIGYRSYLKVKNKVALKRTKFLWMKMNFGGTGV
jgi:hypothetical protein